MLVIREGPISHFISFGTFLKSSIENRGLSINLLQRFSPGPLNYLFVAIQMAGFGLGAFAVVRGLYDVPVCDHCDRQLKNPTIAQRASNSLLDLENQFGQIRFMMAEGRSSEALSLAAAPDAAPGAVHKLTLSLWKCDRCPVEFFSMFIKPGGDYVGKARDYSPSRQKLRNHAG